MPALVVWAVLGTSVEAGGESHLSEGAARTPTSEADETARESLPALPALRPSAPGQQSVDAGKQAAPSATGALLRVGGSLVLVLGVFLLLVWVFRQSVPNGFGGLPTEVFEVLGRGQLAYRQQACLVRCGSKLLLLGIGSTTITKLAEIDEPAEVEQLLRVCRKGRFGNMAAFRRSPEKEGGGDV